MSRKIVCDRCGKDITALPKLGFIGVSFRDSETGDLLEENPLANMDYCPECMEQITAYIASAPASGPAPAKDPEPEVEVVPVITPEEVEELAAKLQLDGDICGKSANLDSKMQNPAFTSAPEKEVDQKKDQKPAKKGPPQAKGIDTGKLLALRKAGWTFQQIADEMKISTATVSYHLTRLKGK